MADELSQEELEQFKKWRASREARKPKSIARRKALTALKEKYADEYKALVKRFGG